MKNINCAICGDKGFTVKYKPNFNLEGVDENTFSARRVPDKMHYRIVKCRKCGMLFSNPILDHSKIGGLYRESKYTYADEEKNLKKAYGNFLKTAEKYVLNKNKILDIGGGNGFFLEEAMRQGYKDPYLVEPSKDAVSLANPEIRKNAKIDMFKKDLFPKNYFDVVCFFQVLDHIIDPNEFLKNCYRVLKPGGVALAITHDTEALSAKIMGVRSPIIDIEHVYLFNKNTLGEIFSKNGFKTLKIVDVTNYFSLQYLILLTPLPKIVKRSLLSSIKTTNLGKANIKLKPGNIGIIARKPN